MHDALETPKILIVDDLSANLDILKEILTETKAVVVEATSGEMALELCGQNNFAAILLDVMMPGMDGFEVARQLRNDATHCNTPILFITAHDMNSKKVITAYDELNVVDFIQKPVDDRILLARVNVFLRLYREKTARENSIELLAKQKQKLENEIVKRQLMEEQLRLSQKNATIMAVDRGSRLHATVATAMEGIVSTNSEGVVVDFNPAAEKLFGYRRAEAIGRNIADLIIPEELRERHKTGLANYVAKIKKGVGTENLTRMVDTLGERADGKKINIEVAISSFSYENDLHITAFFRDITDRKQLSRALEGTLEAAEYAHQCLNAQKDVISQARAYTESIINSMGDALIVLSLDGRIKRVNEPACHLLAASHTTLVGQPISSVGSKNLLSGLGTRKEATVYVDTISRSKDGSTPSKIKRKIPLFVSSSVLLDSSGKETGIILVAKDITEYKKAEEELHNKEQQLLIAEKKASQAKDQFLAHMSHEIRTPMNAIIGLTQQALMLPGLPAKARDYLNRVTNSSHFLMRIIDDILDYSKIEAGKLELESIEFSLRQLFKDLADLFMAKASEKKVQLLMDIADEAPTILIGDSLRLEQIMMNLIANAVKFTDAGNVHVMVSADEKQADSVTLTFSVTDTGIGMSAEHLGKLFQPFVQMDNSTSRKYGGTGLGLSISKYLVDQMGGTILVESEAGKGSKFAFTLNFGYRDATEIDSGIAIANNESIMSPSQFALVREKIGGSRILLVEDNFINQQVAEEILGNVGMLVDVAVNGQEAIDKVKQTDYDLVLMDIQMPIMDGLEATKHIRQLPKCRELPVIAVTAHAMEGDKQLCIAAGMNDHVPKPIDKKQLFDAMIKWIPPKPSLTIPAIQKIHEHIGPYLPEALVGIDIMAGVQRLDGNRTLYRSLLINFSQEFSQVAEQVKTCLIDGGTEEVATARRLVHSIKGMAGNLAAMELRKTALDLEKAIAENKKALWHDLLNSFSQSIATVLDSIATLSKDNSEQVVEDAPKSSQELVEKLLELAEAIQKKRFRARKLLTPIKSIIGKSSNPETIELLASCIEQYDFDGAWQHLQTVAEAMNVNVSDKQAVE